MMNTVRRSKAVRSPSMSVQQERIRGRRERGRGRRLEELLILRVVLKILRKAVVMMVMENHPPSAVRFAGQRLTQKAWKLFSLMQKIDGVHHV
jgi:hypothetical protein